MKYYWSCIECEFEVEDSGQEFLRCPQCGSMEIELVFYTICR